MKKKILIFFSFFWGWTYASNESEWIDSPPRLRITFSLEKRIYTPGEPISLRITIHNIKITSEFTRLKLRETFFWHLNLTLTDQEGGQVEPSLSYLAWQYGRLNRDREDASPQKIIDLGEGETYSTQTDLTAWFQVKEPNIYTLEGSFTPLPQSKREDWTYEANRISFRLAPDYQREKTDGEKNEGDPPSASLDSLPPYEVVDMFLDFQNQKKWENSFQLVDLPSYLESSYFTTEIYERYNSSLLAERNIIFADFKTFLIRTMDYEIVDHEIVQTIIHGAEAEVAARLSIESRLKEYVQRLNPSTGQFEFSWVILPEEKIHEKKMFYFQLKQFREGPWKITAKRVEGRQNRQHRPPPPKKGPLSPSRRFNFDNILFYTSTPTLREESHSVLKRLTDYLKKHPSSQVELRGHTDIIGPVDANDLLSKQRVETVKQILVTSGIDPLRIRISWFGEIRPLNRNQTEEEKALNRRVEVLISRP